MLKLMKPKKYISADKNSSFVRNVMGRNVGSVSYLTAEEELIFAQLPGASENNELEELLHLLQMLASVLEGGWGAGNYKSETYIINQLRIMFESRRVMLSQDALYQQLQNLYNEIVEKIENKNAYEIAGGDFFENVKNELLACRNELNKRVLNVRNLRGADAFTSNIMSEDRKIVPHYRLNINVSEGNLNVNTINHNMFNLLRRNQSFFEHAKDNYFFRESLAVYSKKNQKRYQFRQQITNFLEKLTPNQQSFILEFAKNRHLLSIEENAASGEKKTDVYAVFKNASEREIRHFFSELKKLSEKKTIKKELTKRSETQNQRAEIRKWQEHTRESFLDVLGELFSANSKDEFYKLFSEENIARFTEADRTYGEILMPVIGKIKEILDKKKSRDMVKTISQMNTDTLIAYSDSVMNYIQNSEMDFEDETLKLEENLEQIYYSGNFNQNGVSQIKELLSDYYLTVKTEELESVSEAFFGMENDGRIKEILRLLNQQDLDSIAVFLKLFEDEYGEISEILENYENEKKLFFNNETEQIVKLEKTEETEINVETGHSVTVSKISESLSEGLASFLERLKNEEETRLVSIVDEAAEGILHENDTLTYIRQYAEENGQKEEYEEFIDKIENVFKTGLVNSYKQYSMGHQEYQEIRNEIRELLENEKISRGFVKYLRQEKTQAQEEIVESFLKTQAQEEKLESFLKTQAQEESVESFFETQVQEESLESLDKTQVRKEKLGNFTESQLEEKLSESLFLVLKQLDDTVKNKVKERFSVSGQSVIYFETADRKMDRADLTDVSSTEILNETDVTLASTQDETHKYTLHDAHRRTGRTGELPETEYGKPDRADVLQDEGKLIAVRADEFLDEEQVTTVRADELLNEEQITTVRKDELLSDSYFSLAGSGEISGVLMEKILDESPELTYLQEYAREIGQSDEFRTLLSKIESRLEESLLENRRKIDEAPSGVEIRTEIQNILLSDDLSRKFIRHLQEREESISRKITDGTTGETISETTTAETAGETKIDGTGKPAAKATGETTSEKTNEKVSEITSKTANKTVSETRGEASAKAANEAKNGAINEAAGEIVNEQAGEITDRSVIKSSKDIIERFETVNFKNMTEVGIASMISLTLERIFAGLEINFTTGISEKISGLSLSSDERQRIQVGLKSEAFTEKLMKESPELILLQRYAEETDQTEEFKSLLKKIEEDFRTDLQQSINYMQDENMAAGGNQEPHNARMRKIRYDEQPEEQLSEEYRRENNIVYQRFDMVKEIQELLVNEEFSRNFINYLMKTGEITGMSRVLQKKTEKGIDELTELQTAEILSEYLADTLKNVQTETSKINISKINTDVMQDEMQEVIQREIKNNIQYETQNESQRITQNEKRHETDKMAQHESNSVIEYEMRNAVYETSRLQEEALNEKMLAEKILNENTLAEKMLAERTLAENTMAEKTLAEQTLTEQTLAERILSEEAPDGDSWLTYMKNYAVETEQENELRVLLEKLEEKLVIESQHGEIQQNIEKSMEEKRKYQSDERTYSDTSLKAEIRYLLENSEISKGFMERFESEKALTAADAKPGQYMTENEVVLTQITELLQYRTNVQGYLRQNQMYHADDIKNNRYQSLLKEELSYQYVNSAEEYFENSKAAGEIQYALQPGGDEGADNERVENLLGDVKQKLEQVTRNVNNLNSAQNNMKEEFIRKKDIVSFRKELLNHLEEDISTAGKRQGVLQ